MEEKIRTADRHREEAMSEPLMIPICKDGQQPEYFAELPKGFGRASRMTWLKRMDQFEDDLIITHPDMPPHRLNRELRRFEPIEYIPYGVKL